MEKPWLNREEWSSQEVYSGALTSLWWLLGGTVVWCGFTLFITLVAFDDLWRDFQRGEYIVALMALFPVTGVILICASIKQGRNWLRYGKTPFVLDPYPGAIGGDVGGHVDIRLAFDPARRFTAKLILYRKVMRKTSDGTEVRDEVSWQQEMPVFIEPCFLSSGAVSGTRIRVSCDVPEGKPASEQPEIPYYHWAVSIQAKDKAINFNRKWQIPVFATAEKSRRPLPAGALEKFEAQKHQELDELTEITQVDGETWLRFTPANTRKLNVGCLLFGLLFGGSGVGISLTVGWFGILFLIIFGGVGLLLSLVGLYRLGKERRLCVARDKISTRVLWCGISHRAREFSMGEINYLFIKSNSSMSTTGGGKIQYFKLLLKLKNGDEQPIGFGIDGLVKAKLLGEKVAELTGLEFRGEQNTSLKRRRV